MFYNFDEAEWQKEPHQNSKPRLFRRLMRQRKKKKEEVNFLILVTGNLELLFLIMNLIHSSNSLPINMPFYSN